MPKRIHAPFTIDYILSEQCGGGESPVKKPSTSQHKEKENNPFYREIDYQRISDNCKFRVARCKTKFTLERLEECPEPNTILYQSLKECMEKAIENGKREGQNPSAIGFQVLSECISSGPICIPIRKITPNTLEASYNQILEVASHYEEPGIYGSTIIIECTTLCGSAPGARRKLQGAGKTTGLNYMSPKAIIKICNTDSHCLFYALELSRIYAEMQFLAKKGKGEFDRRKFYKIYLSQKTYVDILNNLQKMNSFKSNDI